MSCEASGDLPSGNAIITNSHRNEDVLNKIRGYILSNPLQWATGSAKIRRIRGGVANRPYGRNKPDSWRVEPRTSAGKRRLKGEYG